MNRIEVLRKNMNISMAQTAKELNIPYTTYVNYEKGTREPNSEMMIKLADFFNVSIDYLLNRDTKKADNRTQQQKETISLIQTKYNALNHLGKQRVDNYVDDLLDNPKYRKSPQTAVQASPVREIAAYGADNSTEVTFTTRPREIT